MGIKINDKVKVLHTGDSTIDRFAGQEGVVANTRTVREINPDGTVYSYDSITVRTLDGYVTVNDNEVEEGLMLTTEKAAAELNIQPNTVRKHIKNGNLKATKDGRDWLIEPAELERFSRERRKGGRPRT